MRMPQKNTKKVYTDLDKKRDTLSQLFKTEMTTAKLKVIFSKVFIRKLISRKYLWQFLTRSHKCRLEKKNTVKYLYKFNAFKSAELNKIDPNFLEELAKVITEL